MTPDPAASTIRPTQQYALVRGRWLESARYFDDGRYPGEGDVALYEAPGGASVRVPASDIEAMEMVRSEVRLRGHWFDLGSLWTTPDLPEVTDPTRGRVRGPVPVGAPGVFAVLSYRGADGRAVAEATGAQPRGWPPTYDDLTLTVPVAELDDYRETSSPLTREHP